MFYNSEVIVSRVEGVLREMLKQLVREVIAEYSRDDSSVKILDYPVNALSIPYRIIKCLNKIATVRDLVECTEMDLCNMQGIGVVGIQQIKEALRRFGYELGSVSAASTVGSAVAGSLDGLHPDLVKILNKSLSELPIPIRVSGIRIAVIEQHGYRLSNGAQ